MALAALPFVLFFASIPAAALNVDRLTSDEEALHTATMAVLTPLIDARKEADTAALLTWDELYAPLDASQRAFLDGFRTLRGKHLGATSHYFGEDAKADIVAVDAQSFRKDGVDTPIDRQYLPKETLDAYTRMMDAMQRDLGRRLLVESGYRAPAYQLYLFLFYMPKHGYSIRETNRFVALPGHSEHGFAPKQAIDFINTDGVNGEDHPEEFEALPEYAWLSQHASEYGFALSYPRNNADNTTFEPWHWRHEIR